MLVATGVVVVFGGYERTIGGIDIWWVGWGGWWLRGVSAGVPGVLECKKIPKNSPKNAKNLDGTGESGDVWRACSGTHTDNVGCSIIWQGGNSKSQALYQLGTTCEHSC